MADQMNLDPLYNPVLPPAPLGQAPQPAPVFAPAGGFTPTQQAVNAALAGTKQGAVTPGYGGGGPTVAPMDMSVQSNVMGAVGLAPPEDKTAFIPEVKDAAELAGEEIDRQVTDFEAADELGGRQEAREAKGEERKADRLRRKAQYEKDLEEAGVGKGGKALSNLSHFAHLGAGHLPAWLDPSQLLLPKAQRKAIKRARGKRKSERKKERKSRKDAWKTYKGKEVK